MNTLEPEFTNTEQGQRGQSETQTDMQANPPASLPEINKREEERFTSDPVSSDPISNEAGEYLAEVTYSCLLIPRFPDHYLTGDITEDLVKWMKQICISYGWRLGAAIVRPGYLQWVMTVPLSDNPARAMRLARKHTSEKIFDEYPRFKQKNMSGDFWAPGFYQTPGDQPLSLESISNFTAAIRKQQGIF